MEEKNCYQTAFAKLTLPETARRRVLNLPAEVEPASIGHRRYVPLRTAAVIAAVLFLMTVGGVALIGNPGIQGWFSQHWQAVFHRSMSQEQMQVIDSMTQVIGQSQTVDGVTVTVDSAAVGDDHFYLLLRVEGGSFSSRHSYGFENVTMSITPDPAAGGGIGSYGFEYHGIDDHGAILLLMEQNGVNAQGFSANRDPLSVKLTLTDLLQDDHTDRERVLTQGSWSFAFELDRSDLPVPLELEDTELELWSEKEERMIRLEVKDIQLTSSGARLSFRYEEESIDDLRLAVLLEDGTEVGYQSAVGTVMEDGVTVLTSVQWEFPVDLNAVTALKIESVLIPVTDWGEQ